MDEPDCSIVLLIGHLHISFCFFSPLISDSAPAAVHRHRPSGLQRLLGRFHEDGEATVGHLALLHGAHQLQRKAGDTALSVYDKRRKRLGCHAERRSPRVQIIMCRKRTGGPVGFYLTRNLLYKTVLERKKQPPSPWWLLML